MVTRAESSTTFWKGQAYFSLQVLHTFPRTLRAMLLAFLDVPPKISALTSPLGALGGLSMQLVDLCDLDEWP